MTDKPASRPLFAVLLTILIALILNILPFPLWIRTFLPPWTVLVVIYWLINLPHRTGLGTAWVAGIFLDALNGTLLGEHAMALVVVAYFTGKFHKQIRMFSLLQQSFCVLLFVFIYQALLLWMQGVLGELTNLRWFWASALTSLLVWPWLFVLLHYYQSRFRVY